MTAEQLERARAERLRHNGNAALTIEEAKTWLEETGLCLYLPRPAQIPTLAPSFVEAVEGKQNPTPGKETLATTASLLTRLVADGVAVPLNLLTSLGEQPDFLVATWVLPYVFALRGERDWRRPPQTTGSRKVSQLSVEVVRILETEGPLTTSKLKTQLGREVTEAATLRAIDELWSELRIYPEPKEGKACEWHLLKTKYMKAMQEGASTSQVTAISVLASIYLPAVIAATSEEVEIFLSPLTSRSKIREVLRGLTATRQINTLSLSAQSFYFVAGTLPDFPATLSLPTYIHAAHAEQEGEATPQTLSIPESIAQPPASKPKPTFKPAAARTATATNGWTRPARPATGGPGRGDFPPRRREGGFSPRREGGFAARTPRPDAARPIRAFPGGPVTNGPAATSRPAVVRPAANEGPRPLRAFPGGPILNAPASASTTRPRAVAGTGPVRAFPGGPRVGGPVEAARPRSTTRPAPGRPSSGRPNGNARPGTGTRPMGARPQRMDAPRTTGARPNGTRPPRPAGARPMAARPSDAKSGKPIGARAPRPGVGRPTGARPGTGRPAGAGRTNSRPNPRPGTKPGARPVSKPRTGRPAAGSRPSGLRSASARPAAKAGVRKPGARPGAKSGKFAGRGGKKRS